MLLSDSFSKWCYLLSRYIMGKFPHSLSVIIRSVTNRKYCHCKTPHIFKYKSWRVGKQSPLSTNKSTCCSVSPLKRFSIFTVLMTEQGRKSSQRRQRHKIQLKKSFKKQGIIRSNNFKIWQLFRSLKLQCEKAYFFTLLRWIFLK